ncbi:helix-turn-helix domain-containing protein [Paraburkholderia lacunae]
MSFDSCGCCSHLPPGKRDLLSVAEVAQLLNVSPSYVVHRLMRTYVLRPILRVHGRRYVLRVTAEAYLRKRRRLARRALRELACIQQKAGAYKC